MAGLRAGVSDSAPEDGRVEGSPLPDRARKVWEGRKAAPRRATCLGLAGTGLGSGAGQHKAGAVILTWGACRVRRVVWEGGRGFVGRTGVWRSAGFPPRPSEPR